MTFSDRYNAAYDFAAKKHEGQFRKGGKPYITHPAAVAEILRQNGYNEDYQITALFHDLLEDTDATEDEIRSLGGEEVLTAVKLLTKSEGYVMEEYVGAIKQNPMAFAVKAADRLHNLRSAFVADTEFKRRYILESIDWYLDFSPEIPKAVKALADSLDEHICDMRLDYLPIEPSEHIK